MAGMSSPREAGTVQGGVIPRVTSRFSRRGICPNTSRCRMAAILGDMLGHNRQDMMARTWQNKVRGRLVYMWTDMMACRRHCRLRATLAVR